jgi:2'-5' RNA ligase
MRCFIAIDIDEKIKEALAILQKKLQSDADVQKSDVKWVDPDSMHLTLKFLGEVKDNQLADVCNITKAVAGRHENFDIDVESVGCFGGKSARVVWVGAGLNCEMLLQLQKDLEEQLASAGWPPEEREFTGHLTLCRVRDSKAGLKLSQLAEKYKDYKLGTMFADSLFVYQSDLTPKGPIYTVLCNCRLI